MSAAVQQAQMDAAQADQRSHRIRDEAEAYAAKVKQDLDSQFTAASSQFNAQQQRAHEELLRAQKIIQEYEENRKMMEQQQIQMKRELQQQQEDHQRRLLAFNR